MKRKLRIVYFGTPDFSARFLERIITELDDCIDVVFLVTQTDKPVGRKKIITPSPVKLVGQSRHIPVLDDLEKVKSRMMEEELDFALVFAYGKILPETLLNIPVRGFWNIHPSLLPKYRGASPIVFPILLGEHHTGVSLMQMDAKMDHGPIIESDLYHDPLMPDQIHRTDLEFKLTDASFELFKNTARRLIESDFSLFRSVEQLHTDATYTFLLKKDHGYIAWDFIEKAQRGERFQPDELPEIYKQYFLKNPEETVPYSYAAEIVDAMYRALYPWPGIWTLRAGKRVKIHKVHKEANTLILDVLQEEGKTVPITV